MSAVRDIDKRQPSTRPEPTATGFWPVSVSTWTLAVGHILPSGDASLSPREGTAAWALRMCPHLPPGAQGRRSDFPTSAVRRQEQPGPRRRLQLSGSLRFPGPPPAPRRPGPGRERLPPPCPQQRGPTASLGPSPDRTLSCPALTRHSLVCAGDGLPGPPRPPRPLSLPVLRLL